MTLGRIARIWALERSTRTIARPALLRPAAAMTHGGDPFDPQPGDPFASPHAAPGSGHTSPTTAGWLFGSRQHQPPQRSHYNTLGVLAPIFAVVAPPAGVVLAHLALPQIHRRGERGRWAAIWGLVIGYTLCAALIAGGAVWVTSGFRSAPTSSPPSTSSMAAPAPPLPPSIVTSVTPAPTTPRVKLDLAQVVVGTCAEIQLRGADSDDALDLFGVPCEHRDGVYTVRARVAAGSDCRSTYIAAPPDHSFALCLNRY
jgi:hypothetical protein